MVPRLTTLLHIFDADSLSINWTASMRRVRNLGMVHRVPVHGGMVGLMYALDKLVDKHLQFDRALFETHGSSGSIYFNDEEVNGDIFRHTFTGRGFEYIFPYIGTRIYFNGCNVADNPDGWDLLDGAGKCFLKLGGGAVFAQTDVGRANLFTGTTHHWWRDSIHYSIWAPGGVFAGHSVEKGRI